MKMKKAIEIKGWQLLPLAAVLFFGVGAITHLTLLLIQAALTVNFELFSLYQILDLRFFFPYHRSSEVETVLSIFSYIIAIIAVYALLHRTKIRIERKADPKSD